MRIRMLKAAGLSAIIIIATIVSLHFGLSLLMEAVTIHSSGVIGSVPPRTLNYTVTDNSEIRALFVHGASFSVSPADWDLITQTAVDYGVNNIIIEIGATYQLYYPSVVTSGSGRDNLGELITAAHSRGIKVHALFDILFVYGGAVSSEYLVEFSSGAYYDWVCPTKTVSRTLIQNIVEELVTNYDIDGFMYDYIRYEFLEGSGPMCYCSECRTKFQVDIGETITNWNAFYEGGARFNEFMEWRNIPIDELVRDMRDWMLAIKPDLEMSAAVLGYWPEIPTTNRWRIGQDFIKWVNEGWLDWVAPMVYMTDIDMIGQFVQSYHEGMGGPEGKIPLVIFLANAFPSVVDPNNFKQQIDTLRANGADGWAVWRYGGPGDPSAAPDIRTYLDLVTLPSTFSISNINVSGSTVSWTTDLPASSKVEYSTSPLFSSSFQSLPAKTTPDAKSIPAFDYWDIDHVPGTIVEDTTPVTNHSVTLTDLQEGTKYYFRVQSEDQSGIATSKVYSL